VAPYQLGLMTLLKGGKVSLSIVEKNDLPLLKEWYNDVDFAGDYERISQNSIGDLEKWYEDCVANEGQWFFIGKQDGTKIGHLSQIKTGGRVQIGYAAIPEERRKGYASDAVQIMVDYLFLSKNIVRMQAETNPENKASIKVLQKAGFRQEAVLRKAETRLQSEFQPTVGVSYERH
jgi:RimJ/RimL family protein N-acetyltransferase